MRVVAQTCSVCVKAKLVREVPNVISSVLVHGEVRDFSKGPPSKARSFAQYKLIEAHCFLSVENDSVLLSLSHDVFVDCTTVVAPGDEVRQDRLGNLLIAGG